MALYTLLLLLESFLTFSTIISPSLSQPSESVPAFAFSWPHNNGTFRAGDFAAIQIKVLGNLENASDFKPIITVNGRAGNSCYVSGVELEYPREDPSNWKIIFIPIRVGLFNVIITEDRFKVLDSSLHFQVSPGDIYPSVSSVSWRGLMNEFDAGTKATLEILPKDAFGNNVSSTTEPLDSYNFTVSTLFPNGSVTISPNVTYMGPNEFGYIIIELVASSSGNFLLQVLGRGANLNQSPLPFHVHPGPLDVPNCIAEWKFQTNSWQIFSKVEMYIYQVDHYGNLVPGLFEFDADVVEKETNLSIPIPDIYFEEVFPGIQLFSFSAVEYGNFILNIFDQKEKKTISNMPYDLTVFVGYCDGSKSMVNGSGLNSSTAGEVAEFSVYLMDTFDYPSSVEVKRIRVQIVREIDAYQVQSSIYPLLLTNGTKAKNIDLTSGSPNEKVFEAAPSPSLGSHSSWSSDAHASAFSVIYTPEKSGAYEISVYCGNIILNGGHPFRKEVVAGDVNMSFSSILKFDSKVPKQVKNEVVVKLVDSFYNPVIWQQSRLKLEITSKNDSGFLSLESVNNSDGSYSAHYMAMEVGSYELCVTYDGNLLGSCPFVVNVYSSEYFPKTVDDTVSVLEDESVAFDALANDFFAASDNTSSIFNFSQPRHGSLLQYGRLLRYTPFHEFYGNDSIMYTISDVNENQATGYVDINVFKIPPQFVSFPIQLEATEDRISPKIGGYSGLRITYSDLMENISVALSAESGSVSLSPMMMELGQSALSIDLKDGERDGLVLEGRVEVVNSALKSFRYLGYISDPINFQQAYNLTKFSYAHHCATTAHNIRNENFSGGDTIRVSSRNRNGRNDLEIPMFVESVNDPPFICVPEFIFLKRGFGDKILIYSGERDEFGFFVGDPDLTYFPGGNPYFMVTFSMEVSDGFLQAILPAQLVNTTELKLKNIYQWQPLQTYVSISKHFKVQAVGIRFLGTINECNEVIQNLYYHGGDGGTVLTLKLNDLGNYGSFPDCAEKQSRPLYTEAAVNLIRRSPMSPLFKHSLGSAIIIELALVLLLGVILLFFTCKCAFLLVNERRKRGGRRRPMSQTSRTSTIHNSKEIAQLGEDNLPKQLLPKPVFAQGKLPEIRQRRRSCNEALLHVDQPQERTMPIFSPFEINNTDDLNP